VIGVAGREPSVSCLSIGFGIDDLHFFEVYSVSKRIL
jgi:hypothetical protein